jgi:hypothetical protein
MQILVCFVVVNRGEVVVDCVVNCGELCGVFRGRKNMPLFVNFCRKFSALGMWSRATKKPVAGTTLVVDVCPAQQLLCALGSILTKLGLHNS